MTREEIDQELETEIDEYWLPLLKTNGKWDKKKIRNELHDLVFIYKQIGTVYCYITGNKLSKPMYYAQTIMDAHDAVIEDAVAYALEEEKESQ